MGYITEYFLLRRDTKERQNCLQFGIQHLSVIFFSICCVVHNKTQYMIQVFKVGQTVCGRLGEVIQDFLPKRSSVIIRLLFV